MSSRLRIATLDSGVFANHPHIQRPVLGGVTITAEGQTEGFQDILGHGTAVCALLQKMAPDADIFSVKIFDSRLATSILHRSSRNRLVSATADRHRQPEPRNR